MHPILSITAVILLTAQTPDTQSNFEGLARQLNFFPTHDFVFGRGAQISGAEKEIAKDWEQTWYKTLREISAIKHEPAEIIKLLKHKNAKVRTLALAALFQREDPQMLPHLAALIGDDEPTAPGLPGLSLSAKSIEEPKKGLIYAPEEYTKQTVGEVAKALLDFWLHEAGHRVKTFDSYWSARKDRKFCASWFGVRIRRIERSNIYYYGFYEKDAPRVQAIRREIDALPGRDRDWTFLYIAVHGGMNEKMGAAFAKRQELFDAANRLGPDRLMDVIFDRDISDDPDLKAKDGTSGGRYSIGWWVIVNASKLLRASDAPALLKAEKTTHHNSPACTVAAAELQPANARQWLRDAFGRYRAEPGSYHSASNRAYLAASLWRLVGISETNFIVDWFYSEKVSPNPHTTQTEIFLRDIKGVRAPADRKLVARLVDDPRFDKLDHQTVRYIIFVANGWTKTPIIGERELYVNWERGGWMPESAKDLQVIASWRDRLRKSRAEWNP